MEDLVLVILLVALIAQANSENPAE